MLKIIFLMTVVQGLLVPVMVWGERKGSAFIQDRIGPNRASIFGIRAAGLLHPLADIIKLITKEDITPAQAHRFFFHLALFFVMIPSVAVFAIIPFGDSIRIAGHEINLQITSLNPGILYIFAISSMSVIGIVLAGWSSNSKYPMLGGLRAAAQMVSYEVTLGLSVVGIIMVYGTVRPQEMIELQSQFLFWRIPGWGLFLQPLGFILFMIALFAETNRNPFDLPEGEQEIVGFHAEYSSIRFAMFFMAEYTHIIAGSALATCIFLGGWQIPFLSKYELAVYSNVIAVGLLAFTALMMALFILRALQRFVMVSSKIYDDARQYEPLFWTGVWIIGLFACAAGFVYVQQAGLLRPDIFIALLQVGIFFLKTILLAAVFIWVRWTLPRFRYDQLMYLGWCNLLPLALLNILFTGVWILW